MLNQDLEQQPITLGSFYTWVRRSWKQRSFVLPVLAISTNSVITFLSLYKKSQEIEWPMFVWFEKNITPFSCVLILQILVCMVLIFFPPKLRHPLKNLTTRDISSRLEKAQDQFICAWGLLWLSWILLYCFYLVKIIWYNQTSWLLDLDIAINAFNNLQTLCLFIIYLILSRSTIINNTDNLPWSAYLGVIVVITAAHVCAAKSCNSSCLTISTMSLDDAVKEPKVIIYMMFQWASAIASGLGFALLIGRLDSKYIGLPTWIVSSLYFYALLQVAWVFFPSSDAVAIIFITLALLLKCLFFLTFTWMVQDGILFFYFENIKQLIETADKNREIYLRKLFCIDEKSSNN